MGTRRRLSVALAGAMTLTVAGCGSPADKLPPLPVAANGYTLGAGDQLRVVTFGEQALSGDYRVSDTGAIAIPLVGSVPAAGLTPDQLAKAIAGDVEKAQLMKNPKIAAEVTQYRPVFILGEVSKPGQYAYQPGMTVLTAVAVAGGFTYRAVTGKFSIVRSGTVPPPSDGPAGSPTAEAVEGRAERQTGVRPGDVITVFERFF